MIKQAEISQFRGPGESVQRQGDRRDRGITEAGWNSPDRPQRVEIHGGAVCRRRGLKMQRRSADGADVRRSCLDTSLNHEIVEVPGMVGSYHSNQFNSSIAKVHEGRVQGRDTSQRSAETGPDDPEVVGQQVFGSKMQKSRSGAQQSWKQRRLSPQKSREALGRATHFERRECRQSKRLMKAVVSGCRRNGARPA